MFPTPQLVYLVILSMIGIQNASRVSRTTCTFYRMVQRAKRWPGLYNDSHFPSICCHNKKAACLSALCFHAYGVAGHFEFGIAVLLCCSLSIPTNDRNTFLSCWLTALYRNRIIIDDMLITNLDQQAHCRLVNFFLLSM